ncbi:aldehyde dehydrogenase family protein [Streptomyces thermocarboxydus]
MATDGVTVNLLLPGRIATDRVAALDAARAEREQRPVAEVEAASQAAIPAGRYGTPAEFGAAAAFLCSAPPHTSPGPRCAATAAWSAACELPTSQGTKAMSTVQIPNLIAGEEAGNDGFERYNPADPAELVAVAPASGAEAVDAAVTAAAEAQPGWAALPARRAARSCWTLPRSCAAATRMPPATWSGRRARR